MEEEIKQLYTKLSGGKEITSGDYIISEKHFNSISCHLFVAELKKRGIVWQGENTSISNLISNTNQPLSLNEVIAAPAITLQHNANGFSIGIDVQQINELPICDDYWEDKFYQMRFHPEEIAYCLKKDNPVQSFAGIYSCKEAIIKCDNSLKWEQISIKHKNEKPVFDGYEISISHSGNFAIAVAAKGTFSANNDQLGSVETVEAKAEQNNIVHAKNKSYNMLLFALILLLVGYIFLRDFIMK